MTAASHTGRGIDRIREKITELPLYHSGNLLKKRRGETDFKKYFAELRGCTIFLYMDEKKDMYTERLELRDLKAMEKVASESGTSVYSITLLNEEKVQLKASSPDAEEWRGYILAVTKMEIPKNLSLLPGQRLRLEDVTKEERERASRSHVENHPPGAMCRANTADLPSCFYDVTRQEAVQMLEANPEYGNIILRPAADSNSYAVTSRKIISGTPVINHYKIQSSNPGFVIQLETSVTVPSLDKVVLYFIKKTGLQPFVQLQHYDTRIDHVPTSEVCGTKPPLPPRPTWEKTPLALLVQKPQNNEYLCPDTASTECKTK